MSVQARGARVQRRQGESTEFSLPCNPDRNPDRALQAALEPCKPHSSPASRTRALQAALEPDPCTRPNLCSTATTHAP